MQFLAVFLYGTALFSLVLATFGLDRVAWGRVHYNTLAGGLMFLLLALLVQPSAPL